jgi:hypothetical protein
MKFMLFVNRCLLGRKFGNGETPESAGFKEIN